MAFNHSDDFVKKVKNYREKGLSYEKIGVLLNTSQGVIYNIVNRQKKKEVDQTKLRKCLFCGNQFERKHKFNFLCVNCIKHL